MTELSIDAMFQIIRDELFRASDNAVLAHNTVHDLTPYIRKAAIVLKANAETDAVAPDDTRLLRGVSSDPSPAVLNEELVRMLQDELLKWWSFDDR